MPDATFCPPWEYTDVTGYDGILRQQAGPAIERLLGLSRPDLLREAKDTRRVHAAIFRGLTPAGFDYYAGHYRGENFICLRDREVGILGDPRVGHLPSQVHGGMIGYGTAIQQFADQCEVLLPFDEAIISNDEKTIRIVRLAVALFVYFLEIHPYLNGNGHIARLFLIFLTSGLTLTKDSRRLADVRVWPDEERHRGPAWSGRPGTAGRRDRIGE